MNFPQLRVLLADDNLGDCFLFKVALGEFAIATHFTIVNNGEQLMRMLENAPQLPDVLFLDMNMPRKTGFECLNEIKRIEKLQSIPVIIFSTFFDQDIADTLYQRGAQHYIQKPREYGQLRQAVHQALSMTIEENFMQPALEKFVLTSF